MIFLTTNRLAVGLKFTNDRNPIGNTWWSAPGKPLDREEYWKRETNAGALEQIKAAGKPVVLFVHGYNESWTRDMDVMQAVVDGLGDDYTLIAFSWISEGSILDYIQDRTRAEKSAFDLLTVLINLDCPDVAAHSMGNFVLQKALEMANGSAERYVNNLVMVAADLPFDVLRTSNIAQCVKGITVLFCPLDPALAGSGVIHGLKPRLGMIGPFRPAPENCHSFDCSERLPACLNPIDVHGAYFRSPQCYELMKQAFR